MNNYGHLYNTEMFVSPSSVRAYEDTLPSSVGNSMLGVSIVKGNHAVGEMGSSQSYIKEKLQNKDVYQKMKNKTIYSSRMDVMAHAGLNQL